jgi:amidase
MARSVADAAVLLSVMAGSDPDDPATTEADSHKADYFAPLAAASLKGKRLGVIMPDPDSVPSDTDAVFDKAVEALKAAGAEIVEIHNFVPPPPDAGTDELKVLQFELKHDLDAYLAGLPNDPKIKTLADVIAFNSATPRETVLFGQDILETAQQSADLSDPGYVKARDDLKKLARTTLDKLLSDNHLDALIRSTDDAAFRIDVVKGDNDTSNSSFLPATAGYPHLTVPMGAVHGLPVGISFVGPAWSEARLLGLGYAFEQATHARQAPQYLPSLESVPSTARAFEPFSR